MKLFKSFKTLMLAAVTLGSSSAWSYDIVKRAKLIDDRFGTMEMMRPYGHNFVIPDFNAAISADVFDIVDAADDIDNLTFNDNQTEQAVTEINRILNDFYNKEKVLRTNVGFGFPIFSFNAFGLDIKPRVNTNLNILAVLTPRTEKLSFTNVINNLDQIPADLRSKLAGCLGGLDDGDDILDPANECVTAKESQLIKDSYNIEKLPYDTQVLTGTNDIPLIDTYVKADLDLGVWFDYEKDKEWFGTLGFYLLGRADLKVQADSTLLLAGAGDLDTSNNMVMNAVIDYKLGYKYKNFTFSGSIEELKLAEISKEEESLEPSFGDDPLFRFHADALYELSVIKLKPFIGSHARSGYGLGDGYYIGADTSYHFWDDRIGLTVRTMIDKEHFTLGLNSKLWFMHLGLNGKFAMTDKVDDIEVSNYYYANLRFFF